jgi:NitT/TauT family transport system permease protein
MKRLVNLRPKRSTGVMLGLLPFVLLVVVYLLGSEARLAANPNDKLLPAFSTLGDAVQRMAFEPSKRSGEILLWRDTAASLQRLGLGVGISALIGLVFGVLLGAIPYLRAALAPLVSSLALIPPLALLPILFIVFGLGELSKVVLIVFGTAPFIIRDLQQRVQELPAELLVKAQTLGASSWQIILRVVLPQVLPRLLDAVRLSLGAAWLFLIAAEAIAATDGLGYRIFLVRRYLAMDVILPYVLWITLLAYLTDLLLRLLSRRAFRWYHLATGELA